MFSDNPSTLPSSADVATVKLGGNWRMPTMEEFNALLELKNNKDYRWEASVLALDENGQECHDSEGLEIWGLRITYMPTRATLFLPLDPEVCQYWTSSIGYYHSRAYTAYNDYSDYSPWRIEEYDRYEGYHVRPVCDAGKDIPIKSISLSQSNITLERGSIAVLAVINNPSNATGKAATWVSSDTGVATVSDGMVISEGIVVGVNPGKTEILAKCGEATAKCVVTVINPVREGAVNMGLSVNWASSNVCDKGFSGSPEKTGDYYAWAETETKDGFSLANYKWYYFWGDHPHFTLYTLSSKRTELYASDDVATKKLGGDWRVPTEAEWRELIDNCSQQWTWINGVNGMLMTSKKNGNSIFLPAAGHKRSPDIYSFGSKGEYWSNNISEISILNASVAHATICSFSSYRDAHIDEEAREFGCLVRPVCSGNAGGTENGSGTGNAGGDENGSGAVKITIPPANEIWYESHSGKTIPLAKETTLLVSNTYSNGKGVYKFKEELTSIDGLFDYSKQCKTTKENEDFKSLILPPNISRIPQFGISHLSYATQLVLPYNLSYLGSDCLCRFGEKTPETSNIFFIGEKAPSFVSTSIWNMHDLVSGGKKVDKFHYPENNSSYNSLLKITIQGSATHYWVPTKYEFSFSN